MSLFEDAANRVAAGADHHAEAQKLVAGMTVSEKLGCLDGDTPTWPGLPEMMAGAYHRRTWPAAKVKRLGIPGLEFSDGPRGCVVGPNTIFPVSMARGASFDPELEERIGDAIGKELRANGATYTGAVCMNLLRHPAWGRAQETYGEDPHHVGDMAAAFTKGLQNHVMACMKHFALNSMENMRFVVNISVDERSLHETYLPHFRKVAAAGVASVMSAYNQVNDDYCGENKTLLTDILREEWGWEGYVTSDFIAGLRDPVKSVEAGLNIEMPFRQQRAMVLEDALQDGNLSIKDIDARITEIIATFLRFHHVFTNTPDKSVIVCDGHRALAQEAASASMVLLRNENNLLPLDPDNLSKIAVLGHLAVTANTGDAGSSNVALQTQIVTPLDGLKTALPDAKITQSDDDPAIADGADIVLVVVGYTRDDEGEYLGDGAQEIIAQLLPPMVHPTFGFPEGYVTPAAEAAPDETDSASPAGLAEAAGGDRRSLRLSTKDEALIASAITTGKPVIVAVMGGSAIIMPWLEEADATLMLWYPGMEGGHAFADVLLGKQDPGGRLPFAIPYKESDLVLFDRDATEFRYDLLHGQWHLDQQGIKPHLPFGFGLGYTEFALLGATRKNQSVTVNIENTSKCDGTTVIQIYGSVPQSAYERAPQKLLGFKKIHLPAGSIAATKIPIDLTILDIREDSKWLTEDKPVQLTVAFHAGEKGIVI